MAVLLSVEFSILIGVISIAPDEVPDICGFLGDKLNSVDNDPDLGPYDDVRNYMYEGEGNSVGSLSSLASGKPSGSLSTTKMLLHFLH